MTAQPARIGQSRDVDDPTDVFSLDRQPNRTPEEVPMHRPLPAGLAYYEAELHDQARVTPKVTDTHGPAAESFDYLENGEEA